MIHQARRTDGNHAGIVKALRKVGVHVVDLSRAGIGVPDLACLWRGQTVWVEVKNGNLFASRQKLTPDQTEFHNAALTAGVTVHVVKSVAEALTLFGAH